jgi:methyl-accepting chemotaxis protein
MKHWTIPFKIWCILTLALLAGASGGGFLYHRLRSVASAYETLFDRDVHDQDLSRVMQLTFKKQVQEWKDLLLRGRDPDALRKYDAAFHAQADSVREIGARLKGVIADDRAVEILGQFIRAHGEMMVKYDAAMAAFTASGGVEQAAADALVKGQDRAPTDLVDQLVTTLSERTKARRAAITNSLWMFGMALCFGVALVGTVSAIVVRGISADLRRTIADLSTSAEQVAGASSQVSASGQTLAQATSEQAASLEQTSASTEETASMTRRNAENSKSSADLMSVVDNRVTAANQSLDLMLQAMDGITASSGKIAKINKVIDEIAFQTNIVVCTN